MPGRVNRQRDGSDHERHGRPGGSPGERVGRAARTERRLAALSAKGRGNVAALAALQQHHNDDEETDQNVDGSDQVNHKFGIFPNVLTKPAPILGGILDPKLFSRNFSAATHKIHGAEGGI